MDATEFSDQNIVYSPVVGETVGHQVYRKSIGGLDAVHDACAELSQDMIYLDVVVVSQRCKSIERFSPRRGGSIAIGRSDDQTCSRIGSDWIV